MRPAQRLVSAFTGVILPFIATTTGNAYADTLTVTSITALPLVVRTSPIGGDPYESVALNNAGQVAGTIVTTGGADHAALYSNGVVTDLGTLGGTNSGAYGINAGQVVGYSQNGAGDLHSFVYKNGVMSDPGTPGASGFIGSIAVGINASGDIAGVAMPANFVFHAVLYTGGALLDLDPAGDFSQAYAINDSGVVVGEGYRGTGFIYKNGTITDGDSYTGHWTQNTAINAAGQIAGSSSVLSGNDHAFIDTNGTLTDLGVPGNLTVGANSSYAFGINASGQVVGWYYCCGIFQRVAFLYTASTGIIDLNSLLPPNSGWYLDAAYGINDSGQIAGEGLLNGVPTVFLLKIDAVSSPVTTSLIAGPAGNNGWYLGPVTVTLDATASTSPVASVFFSVDGGAYQTYASPFTIAGDGTHQLSFYSIDTAGHQEATKSQTITIDSGKPLSHVAALPATSSSSNFTVQWSGSDALSGIAAFTVYVSDNGGAFAPWLSATTATQATYSGAFGHTYRFFSIASDIAGNQELLKTVAESTTAVPSIPASHVAPLPSAETSANFTVQWSGTAPGSSILNYSIYVSDNAGAFSGWLSAVTGTQATYTGVCGHTYGFYSLATNTAGIQESAKSTAEAVTRVASVPLSHVAAFAGAPTSPNFSVQWSGTDSCSAIRAYDIYVSDNGGPFAIWLSQTTATQAYYSGILGHTYGFYSVASDSGGSVESSKSAAEAITQAPAQVAGDVNRDGRIDCNDVTIVKAAIGKRTGQPGFDARADVNSDGLVDIRDLAIVTQKLAPGTRCP